jgi:hypothetical protein
MFPGICKYKDAREDAYDSSLLVRNVTNCFRWEDGVRSRMMDRSYKVPFLTPPLLLLLKETRVLRNSGLGLPLIHERQGLRLVHETYVIRLCIR